jgi:hypothetical protein
MKNIIILFSIIMLPWGRTASVLNGADTDYSKYVHIDSASVYKWNSTGSDWVMYQVQLYHYSEGKLAELLTRDYNSGADLFLSVYSYNDFGRIDTATNYSLAGNKVPSTRSITDYDAQGRVSSIRVQKYVEGIWIEDRVQQNYVFDYQNKLTGYESIYWRSNNWTMPTVSQLSYNASGHIESQSATRPDGNIDYIIVYEYNSKGQQTQLYTQYPSGGGWSNWNLRTIQYDDCGSKASQIQYSGEGPNWVPSTKTVFHTSFDKFLYPGKKVPVCHNGHTIWIAVQALPAHLRHGDCLGECLNEREKPKEKSQNPPFILFPNPAKERITVRFAQDLDYDLRRLELTDFSGNLIKVYDVRDNSDFVIERGNLKSGYYQITLKGEEDWGQTIVFK